MPPNTTRTAMGENAHTPMATLLVYMNSAAAILHLASVGTLLAIASSIDPTSTYAVRIRWAKVGNPTVECSPSHPCVKEPWLASISELNLLEVCTAFGLITVSSHILQAACAKKVAKWATAVGAAYNPLRWLEYSVTAPLMFVAIAVLCGVAGDYTLWTTATSLWAVMLTGGVAEALYSRATRPPHETFLACWACDTHAAILYGVGVVLLAAAWAPIFGSLTAVNDDPNRTSTMPDVVYAIVGFMFAVYACFAVAFIACSVLRRVGPYTIDGLQAEICYNALSLVSKIALHWLIWTAVLMQDSRLSEQPTNDDNLAVAYAAMGGAVFLGVAFAVASCIAAKKSRYNGYSEPVFSMDDA